AKKPGPPAVRAVVPCAPRAGRTPARPRNRARGARRPTCRSAVPPRAAAGRHPLPGLVGTSVADLTLDLRALDEPARLGMQRAAAGRHVTVAAGTQHVEDGIRGTRLRDREPDPHGAGLRLLDQLEAVAEVPADGAFEG